MEKIMAVVTHEEKYARRLCEYVNQDKGLMFTAVSFPDMGSYRQFRQNHPVELLLADREMIRGTDGTRSGTEDMDAGRTLVLEERGDYGSETDEGGSCVRIRKYQPADRLVRNIMAQCEGMELRTPEARLGRPIRIVGVYSPSDRTCAGRFAMALTRAMSGGRKTLYLNLGEFSGMSALTGETYENSISDALYHMKQGTLTPERIRTMIYSYEGIDYIPPVRFAEDKTAVTGEDYEALIRLILDNTSYEALVVDMQSFAGEASDVMDLCSTVYMPMEDTRMDRLQAEEFDEYLKLSGRQLLRDKIIRVTMPDAGENAPMGSYMDSLMYGPVGDLVRSLPEV